MALSDLCRAYYEPVVAYLRSSLDDADAARDMSHAFFATMLAGGTIAAADPERGRFRSYILGAIKHFVSHQREATMRLRRGAGVKPLSLEAEGPDSVLNLSDESQLSPEAVFDRQWAVTVLARAMDALAGEYAAHGKSSLFEQLRPWLLGEAAYGDQAALAKVLNLSPSAAKVTVHRLRQRFRQCVKEEIAGTLNEGADVEDEMRSLLAALGK